MFQSQDGNFAHMTGTKICGIICVSVCLDMQHLSSDWKLQELYVPFTVPPLCLHFEIFKCICVWKVLLSKMLEHLQEGVGGSRIDNLW